MKKILNNNYAEMYRKIFDIMGDLTPLRCDCGLACGAACCKGDGDAGMLLFPHEESELTVKIGKNGERLAVCDSTCDRSKRPLACRIFPFFPTIDESGKIFIEADSRAKRLCPLIEHSDEIEFNPKFFKALKKVGKILAKDDECRDFLVQTTEEIDMFTDFLKDV